MKKYIEYIKESSEMQSIIDEKTEKSKISNDMKDFFDECFIEIIEKYNIESHIKQCRVNHYSHQYRKNYSYIADYYELNIKNPNFVLNIDNISRHLINLSELFLDIKNCYEKIKNTYKDTTMRLYGSNNQSLSNINLDKINIKILNDYEK